MVKNKPRRQKLWTSDVFHVCLMTSPLIPGPASEVPSWTLLTGPGISCSCER